MSNKLNELIEALSGQQQNLWNTTSTTVSEAANQFISFSSPLTVATRTADLYAELSSPMMVVQFAFASMPDHMQVVLLPQDLVVSVAELIQGTSIDDVDENLVADLRAPMEAIVQGICLGTGSVRDDMVVASGLSIRFQVFVFPPNLQRSDFLVRTQIAVSAEDVNGSMVWLMDPETAQYIVGKEEADLDESPFPNIGESYSEGGSSKSKHLRVEEQNALERMYDIPLEVSVELGRVKMLVRDVIDLGSGSILEIDKSAGEPVDVLVNGRLIAKGEVVVIEDNFGVRITEIINPNDKFHRSEAA